MCSLPGKSINIGGTFGFLLGRVKILAGNMMSLPWKRWFVTTWQSNIEKNNTRWRAFPWNSGGMLSNSERMRKSAIEMQLKSNQHEEFKGQSYSIRLSSSGWCFQPLWKILVSFVTLWMSAEVSAVNRARAPCTCHHSGRFIQQEPTLIGSSNNF